MTSIPSIDHLTLDLPPSCIAFCPTQPQYFVVGTYYLHPKQDQQNADSAGESAGQTLGDRSSPTHAGDEKQQTRSGSLELYRLDGDSIVHVATEPTPEYSILDVQWTPHVSALGSLLAVATSTGSLVFYRLSEDDRPQNLVLTCRTQICDASTLVLSLAWHLSRPHTIGVTLSDGSVCVCESSVGSLWSQQSVISLATVQRHSLEAWTLAFADGMKVFSGGDDLVLQCSSMNDAQDHTLLWQDRKIHQAGVTAILPLGSGLVLTGSYDDTIRIISAPSVGRRQVLAEENLGGGVWRLKLLNAEGAGSLASASSALPDGTRSLVILASCMHAGTRMVRLTRHENEDWSFEVLGRFEEHRSMNYGSDVQPGDGRLRTIVSTSFYDKLLCLWHFDVGART